jgi:hypothetical protein
MKRGRLLVPDTDKQPASFYDRLSLALLWYWGENAVEAGRPLLEPSLQVKEYRFLIIHVDFLRLVSKKLNIQLIYYVRRVCASSSAFSLFYRNSKTHPLCS